MSYHALTSTITVAALLACGLVGAKAVKMPVAKRETDRTRLEAPISGHHSDLSDAGSQQSVPAELVDESAAEPVLLVLDGRRGTRLHSQGVPCLFLCLILCCSCCCFSGVGGPPGFIFGTLVPLAVFLYVALGTTILTSIANGDPVGFWCFALGFWAIINVLCGACMLSLMCCGVGVSALAYSAIMGEKPPEKEGLQQSLPEGMPVQGFAAPSAAVAADAK